MQLIDTNVLIHYYDKSDNTKHQIAQQIVDKAWQKQIEYAISVQNLSEFFNATTAKGKLDKEQADKIVRRFTEFSYWHVFPITEASVRLATGLAVTCKAPFFDILIAAVMKENGIHEIITENEKDFENIPGIKVINPFKKK